MKPFSYKGNSRPFAAVLCHSKDIPAAEALLHALEAKGLKLYLLDEAHLSSGVLKRCCSVIAYLSENFYQNETLQDTYVKAGSMEKEIVTLRGDATPMPEVFSNYLYSRNTINLSKYDPADAAAKILSSESLKDPQVTDAQKKAVKRLSISLLVAALLLIALMVIFLIRSMKPKTPDAPVVEQEVPAELLAYGFTWDDIERTSTIILIGERFETSIFEQSPDYYADSAWNEEEGRMMWFDKKTGNEILPGSIDDLSILTLFPNVKTLYLLNQTATELPDLKSLEQLSTVVLQGCAFDSLEGLRDSKSITSVNLSLPNLSDLSPLTGIPSLFKVTVEAGDLLKDLNGFHPSGLKELILRATALEDISSLSECPDLSTVNLFCEWTCPLSDLSALNNCSSMRYLFLDIQKSIDLSFLSSMTDLQVAEIHSDRVYNLSAISSCQGLTQLTLDIQDGPQTLDLSVLSSLKKLDQIRLNGISGSMDFLQALSETKQFIGRLEVSGSDIDWEGLKYIHSFGTLSLDPWERNINTPLSYLQDTTFVTLWLENAYDLDITLVPESVDYLTISRAPMVDLEGLSCPHLMSLSLYDCNSLASLQGISALEQLKYVEIGHCLRLMDLSGLNGLTLQALGLSDQLFLPDFSKIDFFSGGELRLYNIADMTDLSCLDDLSDDVAKDRDISIVAVGDMIENLDALERFHGNRLRVSPQLTEQANRLVENGCFGSYAIEFPENYYNNGEQPGITLNSLEELQSLPKALLPHVTSLFIVGDELYNDDWYCDDRYDDGDIFLRMECWETGEEFEISYTLKSPDLSFLSDLTGLRRLRLCCVSIDDLTILQQLDQLTALELIYCEFPDLSPIFSLDSLQSIRISHEKPLSLNGIQNLCDLTELNLCGAVIDDLSPIAEIDFSPKVYEQGFWLSLPEPWRGNSHPTDLSVLEVFPYFQYLNINNYHDEEWISYLAGKSIDSATFLSTIDNDEELRQLVDTVGSIGHLDLLFNETLTDLSPLLDLPGLEHVVLNSRMKDAIASLDGLDYSFELEIRED